MKLIRNLAVMSAFVALSGFAGAADDVDQRQAKAPKELTRDMAMQRAGDRFDRADVNGDSKLDREERKAAREKARHKKHERAERFQAKRAQN